MQGREAVTISALENSLWLLPGELRNTLRHLPENSASEVCEIRLRRGRLPAVTLPDGEHPLLDASAVTAADLAAFWSLRAAHPPMRRRTVCAAASLRRRAVSVLVSVGGFRAEIAAFGIGTIYFPCVSVFRER